MAVGEAVDVTDAAVNRARGRVFELLCLGATAVGLVAVVVLLAFVAVDALEPFSADPRWHAVFLLTVVAPLAALGVHYYRTDGPAGEVAYVTTGLPVVGALVAGAVLVVFAELLSVAEWFALVVALAAAAGAVWGHAQARPHAPLERLAVTVLAPVVAVYGLPPAEVVAAANWLAATLDLPVRVGVRFLSLREALLGLGVRPTDWLALLLTLTLPVAAATGAFVGRRRESARDGGLFAAGIAALALAAALASPLDGVTADAWVVVVTFVVPLPAAYVAEVLRRGEGATGLLFPAVAVGGVLVGALLVQTLGFAGPDTWLDWGFLTSAHNRTPADAGIYPTLVGSVMMVVVIVLTTFPVGVGAAIYLEEYAPSSGWAGRVVTLIEINIGNLAGVPSVVYGLLGLALFIRVLAWPQGTVVVGGLAVGLLVLPIVIISAQEAIRSVPDSYRRASYGMGATRWQTTREVVLPEALPGVLTGTILALGRAIGETAPLLMVGVPASIRLAPNGFFDLYSAMPRQIFSWSSELDPDFRHGVLAAGVVTLVAVLLVLNATAIIIRNKYQRDHA